MKLKFNVAEILRKQKELEARRRKLDPEGKVLWDELPKAIHDREARQAQEEWEEREATLRRMIRHAGTLMDLGTKLRDEWIDDEEFQGDLTELLDSLSHFLERHRDT